MLSANFYIVEDREARVSHDAELPWPVVVALGVFSRKHLFGTGRQLDFRRYRYASTLSRRKLSWSWFFKDIKGSGRSKLLKSEIRPFNGQVPPLLQNFADHLSSTVVKSVQKANREIRAGVHRHVRPPRVIRWSLKWLALNRYTVSVSDKDGTFCLLKVAELDFLVGHQLQQGSYRHLSRAQFEVEHRDRLRLAFQLAQQVWYLARDTDDRELAFWSHELHGSITTAPSTMLTNLGWTIKTHKEVVAVRLLHLSRHHTFEGFSVLINRWLGPILADLPHLATSTDQVQKLISNVRCGRQTVLVKIDIKN